MPIVDYNRIYHVQSRERRPVLNPVNVPDAAGAFIRAGVPAAGAALPGLRARLDDANARYREKVGRDRDRFRAIGDLIGVGKDVALAYAGAVERRDEADLNALQASWQDHMNQGAEEAWRRPYKRGGENGSKPDGPLVAIRELDAAFDESDAMAGARENVKQRFAEWRQRAGQSYYTKAQRLQADAQDNFQQNALIAKWQAADAAVHSLYGKKLEDEGEWEAAVQEAIEGKIADEKFQMSRRGGVEMLPEQEAIRRRALRQGYEVDRAKSLFAVCAASDDLNVGADELKEGRRIANEADLDEDVRTQLRALGNAAENTRSANVARKDEKIDKDDAPLLQSAMFGATDAERTAAVYELKKHNANYQLDVSRLAQAERVQKLEDTVRSRAVQDAYESAWENAKDKNVFDVRKALDEFGKTLESETNPAAQAHGAKLLATGMRLLSDREKARVSTMLVKAQYGCDPSTGDPFSVDELMKEYQENCSLFSAKQADDYRKIVRDRIANEGRDVPTAEELKRAFEAIGVEQSRLPKLVDEDSGLIRYGTDGWSVDDATWKAWDDSTGAKKDGVVDLNDRWRSKNELNVTREAVDLVMSTMKEFKAAQALDGGKNPKLFDVYLSRIQKYRGRLTNRQIIESARDARAAYERATQGAFKAPGAFRYVEDEEPTGETGEPKED